jgi:hypothetical protein
LKEIGQRFQLNDRDASGIRCGEEGFWIGSVPIVTKTDGGDWCVSPIDEVNDNLASCYGLPVDAATKVSGFKAIASALSRGDRAHAHMVALHLRMPAPPKLAKGEQPEFGALIELAQGLKAAGVLKLEWDPAKHPRWPAGTPDSAGGQFAPAGVVVAGPSGGAKDMQVLDIPLEEAIPRFPAIRIPSEVAPPPIATPFTRNPYPDRPECVKEWEAAHERCAELARRGLLGKHPYKGTGNSYDQCVRGQVTEDCGGNVVEA